jgi:hypothetical protein
MSWAVYGGHRHPDHEVNLVKLETVSVYSERNLRMYETRTVYLSGEIQEDDPLRMTQKIQQLQAAYASDGLDFRYHLAANNVPHQLINSADCLSGVKVLQRPTFPDGDGAQLATTRSFSITLQAIYDAPESDLVMWEEEIETIGDGGPLFFIVDTVDGPQGVVVAPRTAQYYIQKGRAVGYNSYPSPAPPVNPAGLIGPRSRLGRKSGRNLGRSLKFFTRTWHYQMVRDIAVFGGVDYIPISQ